MKEWQLQITAMQDNGTVTNKSVNVQQLNTAAIIKTIVLVKDTYQTVQTE